MRYSDGDVFFRSGTPGPNLRAFLEKRAAAVPAIARVITFDGEPLLRAETDLAGHDGPTAPGGSDTVRLIGELAGLRDAGALSEEEFQAKKRELLKRL